MINSRLVILVILFMFSCVEKYEYESELKSIQKYMQINFSTEEFTLNNHMHLLIIPKLGCSECLKKAWYIYRNNFFSNMVFLSNDQFEASKPHFSNNHILLEKNASTEKLDDLYFVKDYPVFIKFNGDSRIILIEELSPTNEIVFMHELTLVNNNYE